MSNNRIADFEQMAAVFKALSNPHRLRIFMALASGCCDSVECYTTDEVSSCVGELGSKLSIAPSTVSHHIKELANAGLIKVNRKGQMVLCCIDQQTLEQLRQFMDRPDNWSPQKDKLDTP
jgi:DNA-binding transcriptional ArsR family regulator